MLDFETKGYTQYGAQMGRKTDLPRDTTAKIHLQRVRLDSGGYDKGGAYWGIGAPLFCAWCNSEDGVEVLTAYARAYDREHAKGLFPNAKFYR